MKDELRNNADKDIKSLFETLDGAIDVIGWKGYEIRLNHNFESFYNKLNENFPRLSLNERRLCVFLKLEMTSKEISSLTGQSLRAVEISRTRLRKKLGLTNSKIHLYDFFKSF